MKNIEVVASIILKDNQIFITQRGYGEFKDKWEFPGGKIEANETKEDALKREIEEELEAKIKIEHFLNTIEYSYPTFHLTMHSYICSLISPSLVLKEHEAAKFIDIDEIDKYDFLPADILVINGLKQYLKRK